MNTSLQEASCSNGSVITSCLSFLEPQISSSGTEFSQRQKKSSNGVGRSAEVGRENTDHNSPEATIHSQQAPKNYAEIHEQVNQEIGDWKTVISPIKVEMLLQILQKSNKNDKPKIKWPKDFVS